MFELFLKIGGIDMVAVYVALIIAGRRTFDSVPKKLQPKVKAELAALGLDENGNPKED
jgi:dihydrofolate reductase